MRVLFAFCFFGASFLFGLGYSLNSPADVGAYVVLDARTGEVLDEKAKDEPLYPASCTKLASLLYMLDKAPDIDLMTKVVIPVEAVKKVLPSTKLKGNWTVTPSYILETDGSSAGLVAGEVVTVKDLLYGMMLPSGNDAANALAYYWGNRSIDRFVEQLNTFVRARGALHTNFCNPHGLHHPTHVSSAFDLAILMRQGLENTLFREIIKTSVYTKQRTNKNKNVVIWKNTNRLLKKGPYYLQEAIGGKTGHHARAESCFVAAAENKDRTIVIVLLKHPDRFHLFKLAKSMFEEYLNEKAIEKELVSSGNLKLSYLIPGMDNPVFVQAKTAPFTVKYYPSEKPVFEAKALWHTKFPPLSEQDEVGILELYRNGKLIASLPLVPAQKVAPTINTRIHQLRHYTKDHPIVLYTMTAFVVLLGCGFGYFLKKRRRGGR